MMTTIIAQTICLSRVVAFFECLHFATENTTMSLRRKSLEKFFARRCVKTVEIPVDLLADEHHTKINGDKAAIATVVTHGVVLGAEVSPGFSKEELQAAYGVFAEEAKQVDPEYAPSTVNTDGYAATIGA